MGNKISWFRNSFGEEELKKLGESVAQEHISLGPVTAELEAQFAKELNIPYAVAVPSGSVALLISLIACGISPEDEVIMPNRSWIATANAPIILGAKAVLVDVQEDLPLIDASQIREKITPKTKAIIPVHLNGRSSDMEAINKIAKEHSLFVIEDACQAMFSKNSSGFLGTQSDMGCYSLGVTKLISTGQGGMIVTRNKELYEKLKLIRNNGTPDHFIPEYTTVGLNFKFTDMLASIGLVHLSQLKERLKHVNKVYEKYAEALKEMPYLKMIPVNVKQGEVPIYVEVLCEKRDELISFLASEGIETRPFLPNLEMAPYIESGYFPNSKIFEEQGLFLPSGPSQPLENVDKVIEALKQFGREL
ncbi:DegT/DnrJ/EryC1/StrS family aminotransferase [Candidatus Woesearchaeota archaeon]|nr:DegT/DnrJ/EryC1/StrS family aminotransferase [Candidatus Woesearchaeota archaeon]